VDVGEHVRHPGEQPRRQERCGDLLGAQAGEEPVHRCREAPGVELPRAEARVKGLQGVE